ncbi:MAG: hypothetical protein JSS87_12775 [Acidobacteria bacterium]|nr:hypothetical protein [Acidobacteriota bacterium]
MELKSTVQAMKTQHARKDYECDGDGKHGKRSFGCIGAILKGDCYAVHLYLNRDVSPHKVTLLSRHCAHCALEFFHPSILQMKEVKSA